MGNLLFSPSGRISKSNFIKGLGIIVLLHALITMLGAFNFAAASMLGLLSIVLLYPLFCLLIKRSHDGGKSGWMSIVWFILLVIIWFVVSAIMQQMTGGEILAEMEELTQAAAEEGDIGAVFAIAKDFAEPLAKKVSIPVGVGRFVALMGGGFLLNLFIGADADENQFGDVPSA